MIEQSTEIEPDPAAFGDLVPAVRHGRFEEAARHRQPLDRLGWVVAPRVTKAPVGSQGFVEPLPNRPDHAKFVKPENGRTRLGGTKRVPDSVGWDAGDANAYGPSQRPEQEEPTFVPSA